MFQSNNRLSSLEVRAILEQGGDSSRLNQHPLTQTPLFQQYMADHPEKSDRPPGEIVLWLLFDLWRETMYPTEISPKWIMDWHRYLTLVVIYFLPLITGHRLTAPKTLKAASVTLRVRWQAELIPVVANGDSRLAKELLGAPYAEFWRTLIPENKKLTIATLSARREVAVERLTQCLNARLALTTPFRSPPERPIAPGEQTSEPIVVKSPEFDRSAAQWASNSGREVTYTPTPERPWPESKIESDGLFVLRRLGWSLHLDRWLDEPDPRRRLAGELQTVWAMLDSLRPTTCWPSDLKSISMEKPAALRCLIHGLLFTYEEEQALRYTVWLQRADLAQPLAGEIHLVWPAIWHSHWLTGIELLAEAASDGKHPYFTRAVIKALLAREDYLLKLWVAHPRYHPVVCDLLLALGKNLHWNQELGEWELN